MTASLDIGWTDICVGDVWESIDTGNCWRVVGFNPVAPHVNVRRINPPAWDDGAYTFSADTFQEWSMRNLACGIHTDKAARELVAKIKADRAR